MIYLHFEKGEMSRWNKGQTRDLWYMQRWKLMHIWRNFKTWVRKSYGITGQNESIKDKYHFPFKGSSATNVWWQTRMGRQKNLSTRGNSYRRCTIFSVVSAMLWSSFTLSFHCFDFNLLGKIKRLDNKANEVFDTFIRFKSYFPSLISKKPWFEKNT